MSTFEKIKQDLDIKMQNQRENILKVLNGQQKVFNATERIASYTDIYNFIVQGEPQGLKMYELFKHYNDIFLKKSEEIARQSQKIEKNFLEEILNQYQIYETHTRILQCYFSYLDRSFVEISNNNTQYPNLKQQARKQFHQLFYSKLFSLIKEEFKTKLKQDRYQIDKETQLQLQRVYKIIYDMKTFQDQFNKELIQKEIKEDSQTYYQQQYNTFQTLSFLDQIKSLVQFKQEELSRIKLIFGCEQSDLQKELIDLFNKYVINNYAQELYSDNNNDALKNIIFQDCYEQFGQLVQFFDHFKSNTHIFVKKFQEIIIQQGMEIIQERQNRIIQTKIKQEKEDQQNKFLEQLIQLQQSYKKLIQQHAENNQFLLANLRVAFEIITANADQYIIMESLLQKLHTFTIKRIDICEEKQLSEVMQLLECFQAKDLLLKNYQNKLAQRILTLFDYHSDIDKLIIDQFRKTFGPEHTKYLESMIKDYEQQKNEEKITICDIEIQAKILQKEYWPEIRPQINLMNILILNQLKSAYRQKFNSQQEKNQLVDINWQDQISMIELMFRTNQEYKVIIGVVGGAILLQFNEQNIPLTSEQLSLQIGVNNQYFLNQIKLLENRKLLIKDGQAYKFNEDFSNPKLKFRVGIILESFVEYQQEDIQGDRKIAIQAAIVRIMKGKKTLTFQLLIQLVKEQLKMFKPKDSDIKDVIEILMNQEYLRRNQQNMNELIYVS
ncbi:unnamed protein product [Paramecium primaurelia]|uniref:Cullin family profile domain-containing protein n=1 Tax=Paramecium primaurelia TaxID=5886 RepID=A0A8S1MAG2_PARPR|nr:unnamed protein product [Paramecium primaurelia]